MKPDSPSASVPHPHMTTSQLSDQVVSTHALARPAVEVAVPSVSVTATPAEDDAGCTTPTQPRSALDASRASSRATSGCWSSCSTLLLPEDGATLKSPLHAPTVRMQATWQADDEKSARQIACDALQRAQADIFATGCYSPLRPQMLGANPPPLAPRSLNLGAGLGLAKSPGVKRARSPTSPYQPPCTALEHVSLPPHSPFHYPSSPNTVIRPTTASVVRPSVFEASTNGGRIASSGPRDNEHASVHATTTSPAGLQPEHPPLQYGVVPSEPHGPRRASMYLYADAQVQAPDAMPMKLKCYQPGGTLPPGAPFYPRSRRVAAATLNHEVDSVSAVLAQPFPAGAPPWAEVHVEVTQARPSNGYASAQFASHIGGLLPHRPVSNQLRCGKSPSPHPPSLTPSPHSQRPLTALTPVLQRADGPSHRSRLRARQQHLATTHLWRLFTIPLSTEMAGTSGCNRNLPRARTPWQECRSPSRRSPSRRSTSLCHDRPSHRRAP